jgi:hypothetical protein
MRLVLAKLGPHLVLNGMDCIDSSIDTPIWWLPRCVSVILLAHYAPAASCAATLTPAPDHNAYYGIPSHSYLDKGCSTHRSQLPWHRHKGYHLVWALLGFLYGPSIRDATPSMTLPLRLLECVSPLISTPLISLQYDRPRCHSCYITTATTGGSVRDIFILGSYRY